MIGGNHDRKQYRSDDRTDTQCDVRVCNRAVSGGAPMINRANQEWPVETYDGSIIDSITELVEAVLDKHQPNQEPDDEQARRTR